MNMPLFRRNNESVQRSLKPYAEQALPDIAQDTASQQASYTPLLFKAEPMSYGELERLSKYFSMPR